MSNKNNKEEGKKISRRSALKSLGTVGASMTLGAGAVGTAAAVSCQLPDSTEYESEEEHEWKRSKTDYYETSDSTTYTRLTEIQTGLVYQGSEYVDTAGRWFHFFRSAGAVYTQRKRSWEGKSGYSPIGMTGYQKLEITNDATSYAALYTTDNSTDVGAAPSPNTGDNLNFGPAAWTVALAALGTSPYAAVGITAAQALGVLLDNGESGSGDTVTYQWDYDWQNGPCESVHYGRYQFQSFDGESLAEFHTRQIGVYDGHGGVENRYDVYVDPVPDGMSTSTMDTSTSSTSNTQEDSPPAPGTPAYTDFLDQSGVAKKIPAHQSQSSRVMELSENMEFSENKSSNVYRATNPHTKVSVSSRSLGPDEI